MTSKDLMRWLGAAFLVVCTGFGAPAANAPSANPLAAQKQPVLDHLNSGLRWYREIQNGNQWVSQESDTFFWNNERRMAAEILRAAFDSAKAEVPLIAESNPPASTPSSQSATRVAARLDATENQIRTLTMQKSDLDARLAAAQTAGSVPPGLSEQREVVNAQLNLAQAQLEVLQKISSYYSGAADEGSDMSLSGMVAALERSVPEIDDPELAPAEKPKAGAATGTASAGTTTAAPAPSADTSNSIIGRAGQLYALVTSRHQLGLLQTRADNLAALVLKLEAPLRTRALAIIQTTQQVNSQAAQTTDPAKLTAVREQLENSTAQYHELSGALVPLIRETTLLSQSKENLAEWHTSLDRQYDRIMKNLLVKTLTVVAMMALLWLASGVWRRAIFKYVVDVRRRRQLLLTRRIVTGLLLVIIILTGFISDFSSLATFLGFITAGVALALQSVILSVAAYFFLIGRYGVRVGDRVTISGVTGEVIDIGLVRVYLMEFAGTGVDLHPTGRMVVFANSALFSSNPLFKQIPGTEFTWHEIYMPVKPEADLAYIKERLGAVVAHVYQEYRPQLEHQHNAVERLIDFRLAVPEPVPAMRFTGSGIEFVVRYPLELHRGSEVDSKMAHEVLDAIRSDEKLTAGISGMPQIRSAVHA